MKIKGTILAGLVATALLGSCGDSTKNEMDAADADLQKAGKDLEEANAKFDEATKAKIKATEDWYAFRIASDSTISKVENKMNAIQEKIAKSSQNEKKRLEKEYAQTQEKLNGFKEKLNKRNTEFESELSKFDASVAARNESFKMEFDHDMEALDASLKDLFKDNVK